MRYVRNDGTIFVPVNTAIPESVDRRLRDRGIVPATLSRELLLAYAESHAE